MNPREHYDNLGSMVLYHRRYNIGDKWEYLPGHYKPSSQEFSGWDEMLKYFEEVHDLAACFPVYMYDHGGVALSVDKFHCPWDSGQVGFIFVSKSKLRKEYNVKRLTKSIVEKAKSVLIAEVAEYDRYLQGHEE
jgi:hypothetical protein